MEVTKKDILKHYLSSLLVYGITFLLLVICPAFHSSIKNPYLNYIIVLGGYYVLYLLFAYPILLKFKPKSVLSSRSVIIVNYLKKIFNFKSPLVDKLNGLTPDFEEKQALVILFIKAFFGTYCLNLLCNEYILSLDYNFGFLTKMFSLAQPYFASGALISGMMQFLDDTADMWLTLMMTVTTFVFAVSYLTETKFLGNKIKYADTSLFGIISCLACFYPFITLTMLFIPTEGQNLVSINNYNLRLCIYAIAIFANFISMIAILRLGTKAGNLTNRGIVTGFPYNIVRHPDYSMQIVYVVITYIPVFLNNPYILAKILYTIGALLWILIYYLRAITEERNLIADEKYLQYTQKVKHRFIPWVI